MSAIWKPRAAVATASVLAILMLGACKLTAAAHHAALPQPASRATATGGVPAKANQRQFIRDNLWSLTGPNTEDVRQSNIGDCYFDAAMAAVAHAQPDVIQNAIGFDPHTGNFSVDIYDYGEGRDYIPGTHGDGNPWPAGVAVIPKSITVTQQDLKDDIKAGGASSLDDKRPGYIWPAVLEAAYAKLLFQDYPSHPSAAKAPNQVVAGLHIAEAINPENPLWAGGDVDQGMATITGHPGTYTPASLASFGVIASALANHQPVTMGTTPSTEEFRGQLVLNHQYTVLGIAKDPRGNVQLTVRNPWGVNTNIPSVAHPETGVITVDLKTELDGKAISSFDVGPEPSDP